MYSSDLIDRGFGEVMDFLTADKPFSGDIITNPPYKYAQEFVEKALLLTENKVAMFLKLTFLEGQKRKSLFAKNPPRSILVFSARQVCSLNGDFQKDKGSAVCYAWFIWEKGYRGKPSVEWI